MVKRFSLTGCALFLSAMFLSMDAAGEERVPQVKWINHGVGQYYAHPLVADFAYTPGLEILTMSGDDRMVKLINPQGETIWTFNHFDKRLTAVPAAGDVDQDKEMEILIGSGDQSITCLGADGKVEWKNRLESGIVWSGVAIADLDGSGVLSIVTGTEKGDVLAFDGRGHSLWTRPLGNGVSKPLLVADLNGEKGLEVVALCDHRWHCLSGKGEVLWQRIGAQAASSPIAADLDRDGLPEILLLTSDGQALCLEGKTGAPRWAYRTAGGNITGGCGIALGDLDGDSSLEIVFADDAGFVYILNWKGEEIRAIRLEHAASGSASIGDVDGDDDLEILCSGMDGILRCLNFAGQTEWDYRTQRRLQVPPTLADTDQDGTVEILLATGDGNLVCLSCNGKYQPERLPWPSRLFDLGQTGWMR